MKRHAFIIEWVFFLYKIHMIKILSANNRFCEEKKTKNNRFCEKKPIEL